MFGWWKDKRIQRENALKLYDACVKQARTPVFYQELQIDDTLEMRFEMICFHASFVIDWLYKHDKEKLAQKLFDVMFVDIDRNLRESGVGDLAVPKRIKKMMKAFKGRSLAYKNSFEQGTLSDTIKRNLELTDKKSIKTLKNYITENFKNSQNLGLNDGLNNPSKLFTNIKLGIKPGIKNEQKIKKQSVA